MQLVEKLPMTSARRESFNVVDGLSETNQGEHPTLSGVAHASDGRTMP